MFQYYIEVYYYFYKILSQNLALIRKNLKLNNLMEIQQSITYTTLNLTGANYKYVPQKTLNDQYKSLELLYSAPPDKAFMRLIQLCLSDRYLYQHPKIRNKITNHKKGYIPIQDIISLPEITNFVKQINFGLLPAKSQILSLIKSFHKSSKIHANLMGIRRKEPFINKLQYIHPLYIEEYPENDGCEELEILLQATCNIFKINYNHDENWAVIYAQYPQKVVQLHGHIWSINTKLKVQNFQKTSNSFNTTNISQSLNSYQKFYIQNQFQIQNKPNYQYLHRGESQKKSNNVTRKNHRMPFKNQKHVGNRNREILPHYKQFEQFGEQTDFMKDQKEQFERYQSLRRNQFKLEDENDEYSDSDQDADADEDQMFMNRYRHQQEDQKFQFQRMKEYNKKAKLRDGDKQKLVKKRQDRHIAGSMPQKSYNNKKSSLNAQRELGIKNVKQQNLQFNSKYFNDSQAQNNRNQIYQYHLPKDVQQYIDQTIRKRAEYSNKNGVMTIIQGIQIYWNDQQNSDQGMELQN